VIRITLCVWRSYGWLTMALLPPGFRISRGTSKPRNSLDFPLDLVPVVLQDNSHQLTACPYSGFGKKLLKSGLDRALGDSYP